LEKRFLHPWKKDFRYFLTKHVTDVSNDKNIDRLIDKLLIKETTPGLRGEFWHPLKGPCQEKTPHHRKKVQFFFAGTSSRVGSAPFH
jgi:hypothetical protein